jgi:hypothetical protein
VAKEKKKLAPSPPVVKKLNLSKSKVATHRLNALATETIWRHNRFLDIVLNSYQKDMMRAFQESDGIMFFLLCSRRIGKTWVLTAAALKQCLEQPGSRVLFLSTTTDQVSEICDQTFSLILESCPDDIKPTFKQKTNKYVFKNGSEIRIKGMDHVGPNAIRGIKAHLVIFDEACFMNHLNDLISSVVMPMVIFLMIRRPPRSTPPASAGHDSVDIIRKCENEGSLVVKDLLVAEDVLYSRSQIDTFIAESGGMENTVCQREYFCKIITETDLAVFPACTEDHMRANIVKEVQIPRYDPDLYVSMDIGWRDFTVILFAYWDFLEAKLCIMEEVVFPKNSATTSAIAEVIHRTEERLWPNRKVTKRICDTDPRMIADLRLLSGIRFTATKKDNKEAKINQANLMFINSQIQIDPKCKTLIDHCKYGVWKENRSEYQRSKTMGHFDALDALVYLVRNINRKHNPLPGEPFRPHVQVYHGEQPAAEKGNSVAALQKLFF